MTPAGWQFAVSMPAYMAALFGVHELARRRVRTFAVAQAAALLTVPFWIGGLSGSWFAAAKLLTTTIPCLILSVIRIAFLPPERPALRFFREKWVYVFAYSAIQVNIIENVFADIQGGRYGNAFAGVVLMVTMPGPLRDQAWIIECETPRRDALVRITTVWALLYSTWNLASLYAQFPMYLAHVACLLLVPLAYPLLLKRPDLWMSARTYTLSFAVVVLWSGHDFVTPWMDTAALESRAAAWWDLANAVLAACFIVRWLVLRAGSGAPTPATSAAQRR